MASWDVEESNKHPIGHARSQLSMLQSCKEKFVTFKGSVTPTHFQKQVRRGTWLVNYTYMLITISFTSPWIVKQWTCWGLSGREDGEVWASHWGGERWVSCIPTSSLKKNAREGRSSVGWHSALRRFALGDVLPWDVLPWDILPWPTGWRFALTSWVVMSWWFLMVFGSYR